MTWIGKIAFKYFRVSHAVRIFREKYRRRIPTLNIINLIIEQATGVSAVIVKTQKTIDRRYLTDKINLLTMAYTQTYGKSLDFFKCLQLHRDIRKLVALTHNPTLAVDLIVQFQPDKRNDF